MDGNHIGIAVKAELIAGIQLLSSHSTDLAVDQHITFLDDGLCHTAGLHRIGILQRRIQLDKFRTDANGNGIVSLLYNTFIVNS